MGAVLILASAIIGGAAALLLYLFGGLGGTAALMIAFGVGPVAACAVVLLHQRRSRAEPPRRGKEAARKTA